MPVEIDGEQIASWTPVIIRGAVFQIPISFLDENGDPEAQLSASVEITPNGAASLSWTQANGLFTNLADGEYTTNLVEADTQGYSWESGTYRIEIVNLSGFTNPCITEGLIFVKDC